MKTLKQMTVLIVGLGQIGGSIGLELIRHKVVGEVTGYDKSRRTLDQAKEVKAIHKGATKLDTAVAQADLIILATPIRTVIKILPTLARHMRQGAICLDVASTKVEIMQAVGKLKAPIAYISGHPIAGSEQAGIAAAELGKFSGKTFVLVSNEHVTPDQAEIVEQVVTGLGSVPVHMTAAQHDRLVANTSHVPYALAVALAHVMSKLEQRDKAIRQVLGGSFRSVTRVAKSSPELTVNMLTSNRHEVIKAMDALVSELRHVQRMLASKDETALWEYVAEAKSTIDKLPE